MAASRFVDVSEEEINLMKENAIPRNTKHATKFGMTLFKEEGHSPDGKKIRCNTSYFDSETSTASDELANALNMAELVMPKLQLLLEKLVAVELKLEKLEKYVKSVDDKGTEEKEDAAI
ncbi:uncharacterized protein LOC141886847 [Acropora palmata]|uniref:uncharacterized protein LOC141886847 n=1 Tax=Acropora palmata TaxID=6131 RepID=UPI003DA14F32